MRARPQTYKDARFFLLAATITILVSGAEGFAQDSFTATRSFSWLRRTHLSRRAKAAAQSSRSTSSPTPDAQAVSLANLPVATDFDVHTVAASSLPSAPEPKVRRSEERRVGKECRSRRSW